MADSIWKNQKRLSRVIVREFYRKIKKLEKKENVIKIQKTIKYYEIKLKSIKFRKQ